MEKLTLSWTGLIVLITVLLSVYAISLLLKYVVGHSHFLHRAGGKLLKPLQSFSIVYEPIIILIIGLAIILVNPLLHGIIIVVLLVISYPFTKHYIDGRVFLLNNRITKGQHINIGGTEHIIQHVRRIGMVLVSDQGSKFIYYSQLAHENYLIPKGMMTGSFHQLQLTPQKGAKLDTLEDRLIDCPYLDWTFRPEIAKSPLQPGVYNLKILINQDRHLDHLAQWITENGFHCEGVGGGLLK